MIMRGPLLLVLLGAAVCLVEGGVNVGGRGFGDNYEWRSFEDGIKEADSAGKPAMVVIHKSWCAACKALGPLVADSSQIKALAGDFVLINVHDEEESSTNDQYKPDGGYIPRILFYDGVHGKVLNDVFNKGGSPGYKYFYTDAESLSSSMTDVKTLFESEGFKTPKGEL